MNLRSLLKRENQPSKQNKVLKALRNKVFIQAAIAVQTLVIAIALIFGLSAAWYTNVLQTTGLQFQAEAWGFSGNVTVQSTAIEAAPGDSGVIGITIDNSDGEMLDAAVKVTKTGMEAEMQKRLFFYVEDSLTRNGETLNRVYVNAVSAYTYTVLEDSVLTLTEQRANDATLQWQWVYDMLGYYFLGTVADGSAAVEEYLRPVEYDLDSATFDADGSLLTVDGVTTAESFLNQLAAADGYAGDTMEAAGNGYYKVAVDENGYGVWVYLCNWNDIEAATAYDTALGLAAGAGNVGSYPVTVTLVGQPTEITYTQVSTPDALSTALASGENVQLSANLVLTEALTITSEAILDLNGYAITGPADDVALRLTDGADLLLTNGQVVGSNAGTDIISVQNSDLTLSNVTVCGEGDDGIDVVDRGAEGDSLVRLFHCTVDVSGCAVYMCGNGSASDGVTRVVVEDCSLTSDYITIMSNGTATNWGTELQITRSALVGYYAALYQPQGDSITTVTESKLSGFTGAAIKAGTLVVENSEFYGTGSGDALQEPGYALSGFKDTGDALYIEDGYSLPIVVRISGEATKMISTDGNAVRVYAESSPYVDIAITGGSYSSDVSAFLADGCVYADGTVSEEDG